MQFKKVIFALSFLFLFANVNAAESCTSSGTSQNKYTLNGCSYSTQTRTCCSDGYWSDWGVSCCRSTQCLNGTSCVDKSSVSRNCVGNVDNTTAGTQTRTATCKRGSGWSYGSWSGTCTCKSGYTWCTDNCKETYTTKTGSKSKTVSKNGSRDTCTNICTRNFGGGSGNTPALCSMQTSINSSTCTTCQSSYICATSISGSSSGTDCNCSISIKACGNSTTIATFDGMMSN